jgi:hypothetical protein
MDDFIDAADEDVERYHWGDPPYDILHRVITEFEATAPGFELSARERNLIVSWTGAFGVTLLRCLFLKKCKPDHIARCELTCRLSMCT